jgi:hypothetical protein
MKNTAICCVMVVGPCQRAMVRDSESERDMVTPAVYSEHLAEFFEHWEVDPGIFMYLGSPEFGHGFR